MCVDNLLHRGRVERGIDLGQVAARTFLSPQVVQNIDDGRFDALPPGLYARSYVRAFASAVGLDPDEVLRELEAALPRVDDPLPVLREIARGAAPDWPERMSGWGRDAAAQLGALAMRARKSGAKPRLALRRGIRALRPDNAALRAIVPPVPRLLLRRPLPLPGAGRLRPPLPRLPAARCAAACLDAGVLLLLLAAVVQLTAWTSGARAGEVLTAAGEQIAAVWGVLVLLYFVILGGVGGRTPGASVCRVPVSATDEPLGLRAILERAMLH